MSKKLNSGKLWFLCYPVIVIPLLLVISCAKKNPATGGTVELCSVTFPDLYQQATIRNDTALFHLPYGSAVTSVRTRIITGSSVNSSVPKDGSYDYSHPLSITLTKGEDVKKYVVQVEVNPPDTTVRGVWVTNVGSVCLSSAENIGWMVDKADEAGMNVIFVDVFNKNQTLQPSTVLQNNVPAGTQVQMYGAGWDPLQVLIDKAHSKNIKVIPWFEYGFISHFSGIAHPLLDEHPDWVALDYNNQPTVRNGFTWLNGFNPQVQQFMLDLIMEVVNKYDIDGIQCDDHMPAMPVNSGYDPATASLYKSETGKYAPANNSDPDWVQWRADKMTAFAEKIYKTVKSSRPHCVVSFAPGPLGWALQNNLSDWEAWVRKGIVDIMSPLLYRTESAGLSAYTSLIDKDEQMLSKYKGSAKRYFPGIMVKNAAYAPSDDYLASCLRYNRSKGISGEVFWYYDGLDSNMKVYKAFYPAKAVFPAF